MFFHWEPVNKSGSRNAEVHFQASAFIKFASFIGQSEGMAGYGRQEKLGSLIHRCDLMVTVKTRTLWGISACRALG